MACAAYRSCMSGRLLFLASLYAVTLLGVAPIARADVSGASIYAITSATHSHSSTQMRLNAPSGIAHGDLLVVFLAERSTDAQNPPSGFTLKRLTTYNGYRLYCFYRVAQGMETTPAVFNFAATATNASAVFYVIQLADQANPFEGDAASTSTSNGGATIPSLSPVDAPTLEIGVATQFRGDYSTINFTPPSGWTEDAPDVFDMYYNTGSGTASDLEALHTVRASSGATGSAMATSNIAAGFFIGMSLSVRSALSREPEPRSLPTVIASGTPGVGQVLTATDATWSELPVGTTFWQWQSDLGGNGVFSNISGATSQNYQLTGADSGNFVRVVAMRTSSAGSTSIASLPRNTLSNVVAVRSVSVAAQATGSTHLTLSKPTGVQPGDLLLIFLAERSTRDQTSTASAAGFSVENLTNSSGLYFTYCFYKIAGTSEASTVVFDQANTYTPASAAYIAIKNVDTTAPFEDMKSATSISVPVTLPSLTTAEAPTLEVGVVAQYRPDYSTFSFTPPSGWTENADVFNRYYDTGSGTAAGLEVSNIRQEIAGAIGSATASSSIAAGYFSELSLAIRQAGGEAPSSQSAPVIVGDLREGETVSTDGGVWNNAPISPFSYQWQQCDSSGVNCFNLPGATSSAYTIQHQAGNTLRVVVTASNSSGASTASSGASPQIASAAPALLSAPTISGRFQTDGTLTADHGSWTDPFATFSYSWMECDANGSACYSSFDSQPSHSLQDVDEGRTFVVQVTAQNSWGQATTVSAPSSVIINQNDLLSWGMAYRPALMFDSTEHYRPITVDSLLAEGDHQRCDWYQEVDPTTGQPFDLDDCHDISSVPQLTSPLDNPPITYITSTLAVWAAGNGTGASDYYAALCASENQSYDPTATGAPRDCGDVDGVYYDFGQSLHGYRFLDYWFFYRYNSRSWDYHEGDWEGVTVELAPNAPAIPSETNSSYVVGVIFWAHGHGVYRLHQDLQWCIDGASVASTDCSTSKQSSHVAAFVASGTHATYEQACDDETNHCWNPRLNTNNESSHSGSIGWIGNATGQCASSSHECVYPLTDFDGTALEPWLSWTGRWGNSAGDAVIDNGTLGYADTGSSPRGPQSQTPYLCTQTGWFCSQNDNIENGPVLSALRLPTSPSTAERPLQAAASPSFVISRCSSYYDGALAAFACSPSELTRAVKENQLTRSGHFSITVKGLHTGTAPGLVHVLGGPLRPGAVLRFAGRPAKDEVVKVNCFYRQKEYVTTLTKIAWGRFPHAALLLREGRPYLRLVGLRAKQATTVLKPSP